VPGLLIPPLHLSSHYHVVGVPVLCHKTVIMRTIMGPDFNTVYSDKSVVTVGNFDGVHRGHKEIFSQLVAVSRELQAKSVVVTFDPHPLKLLAPSKAPKTITSLDQKRKLIAESDIDLLVVIPFTELFASLFAEQFVNDILCFMFNTKHLIIGHDYAFGKNRQGNETLLRSLGLTHGFKVQALDPVGDGPVIFSSSIVRKKVTAGEIEGASEILGRCYSITGRVVHGREIGRKLGFPTANIVTENELIPADGVYAVWVEVGGKLHPGACSIGNNPTFSGGLQTIETFLLDFEGDLYEQDIVVQFVSRIRGIRRFADASALMAQIKNDISQIRTLLATGLPVEVTD
jgi:riboflavin kinase / FMN adenylyltransferase